MSGREIAKELGFSPRSVFNVLRAKCSVTNASEPLLQAPDGYRGDVALPVRMFLGGYSPGGEAGGRVISGGIPTNSKERKR